MAAFPGCDGEYGLLIDCMASAPPSAWSCVDGQPEFTGTNHCLGEQDLLVACVLGGTGGGTGGAMGVGGTGAGAV